MQQQLTRKEAELLKAEETIKRQQEQIQEIIRQKVSVWICVLSVVTKSFF